MSSIGPITHLSSKILIASLIVAPAVVPIDAQAESPQVRVSAELGRPVVLAGQRQRGFLKIGLTGFDRDDKAERPPLNIAIVLDKSSSMSGAKIAEARRAAMMTVDNLSDRDFVSVITYDSVVNVVVPATRVKNKAAIKAAIRRVQPGGMTALFAGVSRGASELREFLNSDRVNRVILLSDGMANVGPSSAGELAKLGSSLGKEGIAVTTFGLGLGYNEDLMYKLAVSSDGNHAFIENAGELAKFFELEFSDVVGVVAQSVDVDIRLKDGVRPVRVLGRDALIDGQRVTTHLNQLLAKHEKYVMLEVELDATAAGSSRSVATVDVTYANMATSAQDRVSQDVSLKATRSASAVERATNKAVMVSATEMLANEQSKIAMNLRDEGKVDDARRILNSNAVLLREAKKKYKSKKLEVLEGESEQTAKDLDGDSWNRARKRMRKVQHLMENQSTY